MRFRLPTSCVPLRRLADSGFQWFARVVKQVFQVWRNWCSPAFCLMRVVSLLRANYRDGVLLETVPIPDEHRLATAHEVDNRMQGYQCLLPLDYEIGRWVDFILTKIEEEGKLPPVTCKEVETDGKTEIDGVIIDEIDRENWGHKGTLFSDI